MIGGILVLVILSGFALQIGQYWWIIRNLPVDDKSESTS